jgi:hypothetical protein
VAAVRCAEPLVRVALHQLIDAESLDEEPDPTAAKRLALPSRG